MSIVVTSTAFANGSEIPARHTCDGDNVSPGLTWSGIPSESQSLVVICEDPDAPSGIWTHWVIYGLEPTVTAIPEGDNVRIEVADNGAGGQDALVATQSTGVGLANTRDRLAQAYGERHRFATRKNEQGGFSVIVEIPLDARPLRG